MIVKNLTYKFILFLYFSRFILSTVPGQFILFMLFTRRPYLPLRVWFYLLIVTFYWTVVLCFNFSKIPFQHLLFYFSFVPTFLILVSYNPRNLVKLFLNYFGIFILFLTLIEAFLINSSFIKYLYFLPPAGSSEYALSFGLYQRPFGVCGNATMTTCTLVFASALGDTYRKLFPQDFISTSKKIPNIFSLNMLILFLNIVLLMSGTGLILFLIYLFMKCLLEGKFTYYKVFISILVLLFISLFIVSSFTLLDQDVFHKANKFSFTYISYIVLIKYYAVFNDYDPNTTMLVNLLGQNISLNLEKAITSGDFGFIVMHEAIGIIGLMLVLLSPFVFIKSIKHFTVPIVIFYLSFIHYPALLSAPGAINFGILLYLLNRNKYNNSIL